MDALIEKHAFRANAGGQTVLVVKTKFNLHFLTTGEISKMTNTALDTNRFVLITGCSGGGKSSLLSGLKGRGYNVVEEPGRRIVEEEKAGAGAALPWVDLAAFARRAVVMSRSDHHLLRHLREPLDSNHLIPH